MSIVLTQPHISSTRRKTRPSISLREFEFTVFCPRCGTLETVWLSEFGVMVPTRKFNQEDGRIYHDCGADEPCRFYRIS